MYLCRIVDYSIYLLVTYMQDRYAYTRDLPRLDEQQDWKLISATEQDGYTIIEMERPLETCDSRDDFTLNVVNYKITLWLSGTFSYLNVACVLTNLV